LWGTWATAQFALPSIRPWRCDWRLITTSVLHRDQFTESVAYQLTTEQCCRLNKLTRGPLHPWLDPAYRLERRHLQHINLDELQHNKLLQYSKSTTSRGIGDSRLSVNQSCIFRVVRVIKSLQDPLERGNNLPGSTFATTYRKIYSI